MNACIVSHMCNQGRGGGQCEVTGGNINPPVSHFSPSDALRVQQKLDETTRLLRDLQEAQKERLSTKQPPNMICLLAPTEKELELGKDLLSFGKSRKHQSDLPRCSS